jgi:hypothetical protein
VADQAFPANAVFGHRSHLVTRFRHRDQRPANADYPACAKLPTVHHAYEFFYGFSPGPGEVARSVMH